MRYSAILFFAVCLCCAACSPSQPPQTAPAGGPPPSAPQTVTVFMYSEYIDPEMLTDFEKTTGKKVRLDVYESTEDMMAKMQQSGDQYDVVVVSDHIIPVMAKLNMLQPLDTGRISNRANVAAKFQNPPYDPENRYSIPYQWGTMGLMYRKDKVPQLDPSWGAVLDPARQPGPVVLIDSMRDLLAAALYLKGCSANSRKAEELKAAGDLILKAKQGKVLGFEGGVGGVKKVLAGEAVAAIVYNGDAVRELDPNTAFLIPREGTIIWVDAMVVPAKAPNKEGAHQFIDFILDAKNGARLSNFNRYPTPNQASLPMINEEDRKNPAIYPADEVVARMEFLADVGEDTRLYDETWTRIKARQ